MKKILLAATLFAITATSIAADVGVSINIGQPGFYGQIDIGNAPPPRLVYARPIIVQQTAHYVEEPMYLRVPPGHAKKWSKHCGKYNACNRKVFFVQDNWYNNVYAPHYRNEHKGRSDHDGRRGERNDHDQRGNNGKHNGKGHNKD